MFDTFLFCLFCSMARKRKTEATNTAPSPKRTTRATSRVEKASFRGGAESDATADCNEAKKHLEQVFSHPPPNIIYVCFAPPSNAA